MDFERIEGPKGTFLFMNYSDCSCEYEICTFEKVLFSHPRELVAHYWAIEKLKGKKGVIRDDTRIKV